MPVGPERTRQIIGWIGIIAFVALFGALAIFERNGSSRGQSATP